MKAMFKEGDDGNHNKNHKRHCQGDGDMAGKGKAVGHHTQEVSKQYEHEDRKYEGKVRAALFADIIADHFGDKLITKLRQQLPSSGNAGTWPDRKDHQQRCRENG